MMQSISASLSLSSPEEEALPTSCSQSSTLSSLLCLHRQRTPSPRPGIYVRHNNHRHSRQRSGEEGPKTTARTNRRRLCRSPPAIINVVVIDPRQSSRGRRRMVSGMQHLHPRHVTRPGGGGALLLLPVVVPPPPFPTAVRGDDDTRNHRHSRRSRQTIWCDPSTIGRCRGIRGAARPPPDDDARPSTHNCNDWRGGKGRRPTR